ncbi:hypothetical protein [Tropicimonas sediminicola]|uniref:50S ribosomal protein L35 n=1 Tax=Tropicimonas sediminicola TaxID=1031541 RepID=A0A239I704_9RHOB|nr:hypothetical protein [Tropicimonas sediminicola]SNS89405.1 hypothetical protein SAMN05421757_104250 [Tropicimonas sediminicola]
MILDSDLIFTIGILMGLLAFPSLLSAFSGGRSPRTAAVLFMICIGLITTAVIMKPSGYSVADAPDVVVRVFNRLLN